MSGGNGNGNGQGQKKLAGQQPEVKVPEVNIPRPEADALFSALQGLVEHAAGTAVREAIASAIADADRAANAAENAKAAAAEAKDLLNTAKNTFDSSVNDLRGLVAEAKGGFDSVQGRLEATIADVGAAQKILESATEVYNQAASKATEAHDLLEAAQKKLEATENIARNSSESSTANLNSATEKLAAAEKSLSEARTMQETSSRAFADAQKVAKEISDNTTPEAIGQLVAEAVKAATSYTTYGPDGEKHVESVADLVADLKDSAGRAKQSADAALASVARVEASSRDAVDALRMQADQSLTEAGARVGAAERAAKAADLRAKSIEFAARKIERTLGDVAAFAEAVGPHLDLLKSVLGVLTQAPADAIREGRVTITVTVAEKPVPVEVSPAVVVSVDAAKPREDQALQKPAKPDGGVESPVVTAWFAGGETTAPNLKIPPIPSGIHVKVARDPESVTDQDIGACTDVLELTTALGALSAKFNASKGLGGVFAVSAERDNLVTLAEKLAVRAVEVAGDNTAEITIVQSAQNTAIEVVRAIENAILAKGQAAREDALFKRIQDAHTFLVDHGCQDEVNHIAARAGQLDSVKDSMNDKAYLDALERLVLDAEGMVASRTSQPQQPGGA